MKKIYFNILLSAVCLLALCVIGVGSSNINSALADERSFK